MKDRFRMRAITPIRWPVLLTRTHPADTSQRAVRLRRLSGVDRST
jgi:hypothetical protein